MNTDFNLRRVRVSDPYRDGSALEFGVPPGASSDEEEIMRKKIINTLKIFPRVSPSMMQAALGPHNSARFWKPILEDLINEGIVQRTQEPHLSERNRHRTVIVLSLVQAIPTATVTEAGPDSNPESGELESGDQGSDEHEVRIDPLRGRSLP